MKKNIKEIQKEINHYNPPKRIANAMLLLGKLGFIFGGHGLGMGGEDFSLWLKFKPYGDLHVIICDGDPSSINFVDSGCNEFFNREGTPAQVIKLAQKWIKFLKGF